MESEIKVLESVALELRYLSEAWRNKATGLEMRHGKSDPHTTKHVVSAFETCAEEIEEVVKTIQTKAARIREAK
jgi:hypothetical protein